MYWFQAWGLHWMSYLALCADDGGAAQNASTGPIITGRGRGHEKCIMIMIMIIIMTVIMIM